MVKHTFFAIGLGITVFFLYLFQYTGAFKSVTLAVADRPAYHIIYKDFIGPYHKIVKTIEEVEKWVKSQGLSCRLSFGEYFDDPQVIEEGRLKSRGGCLIDPIQTSELQTYNKWLASTNSTSSVLPKDVKLAEIEPTKAVVALFEGAPGIGPLKVYPKAEEYIRKNNLHIKGNVLEIYEIFDQRSMQTTYIWPLR